MLPLRYEHSRMEVKAPGEDVHLDQQNAGQEVAERYASDRNKVTTVYGWAWKMYLFGFEESNHEKCL